MKIYTYYVRSKLKSYRDSSTVHIEDIPFLDEAIQKVLREEDFRFFVNKSIKDNEINGRLEVVTVGREIENNLFNSRMKFLEERFGIGDRKYFLRSGSCEGSEYFLTLRYCKNVDDGREKEEYEEKARQYMSAL